MKFGMEFQQDELERIIIENRASAVLFRFLKSLNVKGHFILPVNICPIVPLVFEKAHVAVEYVDINSTDFCIDYDTVLAKLKSKNEGNYTGILFNHTYGFAKTPSGFFEKVKQLDRRLIIIDDKCLCEPDFSKIDTNADLTLFSTGYAKHVDLSVGGIGFVKNEIPIINPLPVVLNSDITLSFSQYKIPFSEYLSVVEKERLIINNHKNGINSVYNQYLSKFEQLGSDWNNWRYNILLGKKSDLILQKVFENGFFASKHYKPIMAGKNYENSQVVYSGIINLFNDKYFTVEKAESLAKLITKIA